MKKTKLIMTSSSLFMGVIGVLLTFLPLEFSRLRWIIGSEITFQIMGALYFGFAMINWMLRSSLIGGIYNRPLAVGNFSHFSIAALSMIKFSPNTGPLLVITSLYVCFSVAFGFILMTHPIPESKGE